MLVWSDRISESELQTVVCKEVEECVQFEGKLVRMKRASKQVRVLAFKFSSMHGEEKESL